MIAFLSLLNIFSMQWETKKKSFDMLYFGGRELNLQYLRDMPVI